MSINKDRSPIKNTKGTVRDMTNSFINARKKA